MEYNIDSESLEKSEKAEIIADANIALTRLNSILEANKGKLGLAPRFIVNIKNISVFFIVISFLVATAVIYFSIQHGTLNYTDTSLGIFLTSLTVMVIFIFILYYLKRIQRRQEYLFQAENFADRINYLLKSLEARSGS
jgi:hypothetical protein